jgi:hypothetical protein
LSLVKMTPHFRYHKNILIFIGVLIGHKSCDTLTQLLTNAAYKDLIEKLPDECNVQIKTFLSSCKFTSCRDATILCQSLKFLPARLRRKEIFSGDKYFCHGILLSSHNVEQRGKFSFQRLTTQSSVHPKTNL